MSKKKRQAYITLTYRIAVTIATIGFYALISIGFMFR